MNACTHPAPPLPHLRVVQQLQRCKGLVPRALLPALLLLHRLLQPPGMGGGGGGGGQARASVGECVRTIVGGVGVGTWDSGLGGTAAQGPPLDHYNGWTGREGGSASLVTARPSFDQAPIPSPTPHRWRFPLHRPPRCRPGVRAAQPRRLSTLRTREGWCCMPRCARSGRHAHLHALQLLLLLLL